MRFRRLHARAFGVLRDRALELPAETVLIFGSNESGKSTLRSALETILYGFDPANRGEHPLAVWDAGAGGDPELAAEIEQDAGTLLRIERELRSRGRLRISEGSAAAPGPWLSNVALECVSSLPRELFRAVYSLELEQLAALDAGVQAHVDELLLPQAAALPLRPVADLRDELRKAHLALWRIDKRGITRAGELREEIRLQRKQLNEAALRERELRESRSEQARLAERVRELEAERRQLDVADRAAPFLGRLHAWKRRRHALGPPVDLSGMGEIAFADPALLARESARIESSRREPIARLEREPETLGEHERALLGAASDIELARQAAGEHRSDVQRRDEQRRSYVALRESAARDLGALLGRTASSLDLEVARALPLEALRAAHAQWAAARAAHLGARLGPTPLRMLVAAVTSFALAAALAWLEPALGALARPFAVGAAALGLATLFAAWIASRRRSPAPAQLAGLLSRLAPAAGLLESPDALLRLIERLERAQDSLAKLRQTEVDGAELGAALDARRQRLAALCARLGIGGEGDVEACVARLGEALRRSREREQQVERDRQERLRAQERIETLRPEHERAALALERVEKVLESLEPGAAGGVAFARVEARRQEAKSLQELESELRRDPRFDAFEHDARIAPERDASDAEWQPEATARRASEREACEAELRAAHTRLGEIASLLREDPGSRQARAADCERAAEEALTETQRERDRLALLEAIVKRAERDFRERHQPDVLRRASGYLERVTHRRWRRVDLSEGAAGGLSVCGDDPSDARPVAAPLSRGTLDQIFLCLRLGLLDHLDEGRERLPLVLDDALLRMDELRRGAVYELLGEISRRRQVFLLTCQEWIAAEAERALGLQRITLVG